MSSCGAAIRVVNLGRCRKTVNIVVLRVTVAWKSVTLYRNETFGSELFKCPPLPALKVQQEGLCGNPNFGYLYYCQP